MWGTVLAIRAQRRAPGWGPRITEAQHEPGIRRESEIARDRHLDRQARRRINARTHWCSGRYVVGRRREAEIPNGPRIVRARIEVRLEAWSEHVPPIRTRKDNRSRDKNKRDDDAR